MRKGKLAVGIAIGTGVALLAPDAWATTGFQGVDQGINTALTAIMGAGGAVGAGGVIEALTGWRFGHSGIIMSGGKTAITGGGIGGAGAISTTVIGSGTSFDGTMLPVSDVMSWAYPILSLLN